MLIDIWQRLPFLPRLLVTASTALLVAGSAMVFVSVKADVSNARNELQSELSAELEVLPAALAEAVVVGDYSAVQQFLDRYVQRPRVVLARLDDVSGARLSARDSVVQPSAPEWFVTLSGFEILSGSADVIVGGRRYASLTLTLSPSELADKTWDRLLRHLGILFLAVAIDFVGIWLVLRSALMPLKLLQQGVCRLAEGELGLRLQPSGSPETRRLMAAFNDMAASLQSAQSQVSSRNQALQRFSEIAAHHLQEPTRRVLLHSRMINKMFEGVDLPNGTAESLEMIISEAARLRALLRDIELYLAADQPLGHPELVDCRQQAVRVANSLSQALAASGGTIEVAALPQLTIDPRRLRTVFEILFENAIRYGLHKGGARILVDGGRSGGDDVWVRVSDDGPGIAPEFRERVFQVFERLSPQPGDGSTGVGLAIVRRIAENTGGTASVEDSPLGGAAVRVVFGPNPPPRPPGGGRHGVSPV